MSLLRAVILTLLMSCLGCATEYLRAAICHDILEFPERNSAGLPARQDLGNRKPPAGRAPGTALDLPHVPSSGSSDHGHPPARIAPATPGTGL